MKKVFFLFVSLMPVFITNAQDLTVMTYNIRLNLKSDGVNAWPERKDFFTAQIQFYDPDIFGVQEALPDQVNDIKSGLPGYTYVGQGRDGNNKGESAGIFYNTRRFILKKSGTFWLSETPDTVSRGWDAAYNRVCTYVLLFDKKAKRTFWMFNTHLDNEGEVARTKGLELILSRIAELNTRQLPVILTGDFNSEPSTERIKNLQTQMDDARTVSLQKPFGPSGTFNGFKHNEPVTLLIDYIFISKKKSFIVNKYAVLSDAKDLRYPSDHLPVYVALTYR